MKKFFALFLSIWCMPLLFAQDSSGPIAVTDDRYDEISVLRPNPVIKGKIHHATEDELSQLSIGYTLVRPNDPFQVKYNADIAADGTFEFTLPSNLPYQQIWFSLGNYLYTCLLANEELQVDFDLPKIKAQPVFLLGDGIAFSGKDGRVNKEYNAYTLYHKKELPDLYLKFQELAIEDPSYLKKIDSLLSLQKSVDTQFLKEGKSLATRKIIESQTALEEASYKLSHALSKKIEAPNLDALILPVFAITNDSYDYLQRLFWYARSIHFQPWVDYRDDLRKFEKIDSIYPDTHADLVKLQVNDKDLAQQLVIYQSMQHHLKRGWAEAYVDQEYRATEKKLNKIQNLLSAQSDTTAAVAPELGAHLTSTSFQATFYRNEAETAEELLKRIQSSFPNKLIVLDLWATWCQPCLQNMPHQKTLYQQAREQNLPIEFVYLCTEGNSSESTWKNKIAELEQPGAHIFVPIKQMNELMTLLNGSGYPTYALIKPSGEIDTKTMQLNRQLDIDQLKTLLVD